MLEQFVAEDPTDPFNHYALALELTKSDKQKAKEVFDKLISTNPDYVATYYQAALLYLELSLNEEAMIIIERGIAQACRECAEGIWREGHQNGTGEGTQRRL